MTPHVKDVCLAAMPKSEPGVEKISPEIRRLLRTHSVPLSTPVQTLRERAKMQMESYLTLLERRLHRETMQENHVREREKTMQELLSRLAQW